MYGTPGSQNNIPLQLKANAVRAEENPWGTCNQAAKTLTSETYLTWKDELEKLLIFAALFSGVVTSFTSDANKAVQGDSSDKSAALLQSIALYLSNHNFTSPQANASIDITDPPISKYSQHISLFYSLSLALILASVLGGIVCLQWLRVLGKNVTDISNREDLSYQYQRHESLRKWRVFAMLNTLPSILLLAVAIFFAGFLESLWSSQSLAAIPVAVIAVISLLFIITTSILPAAQVIWFINWREPNVDTTAMLCPYRSPQAWLVHVILKAVIKSIQRFSPSLRLMWSAFSELDSWVAYDNWKDKRYKTDNSIFISLIWLVQNYKQHSKVVSEAYTCFLIAIRERCQESSQLLEYSARLASELFTRHVTSLLSIFNDIDFESSPQIDNNRLAAFNVLFADAPLHSDKLLFLLPNNLESAAHYQIDTLVSFLKIFVNIASKPGLNIDGRILDTLGLIISAVSSTPSKRQEIVIQAITEAIIALLKLHQFRLPKFNQMSYIHPNIQQRRQCFSTTLQHFMDRISMLYVTGDDEWRNIHIQIFHTAYNDYFEQRNTTGAHATSFLLLPDSTEHSRMGCFTTGITTETSSRYANIVRDIAVKGYVSPGSQWYRVLRLVPHIISGSICPGRNISSRPESLNGVHTLLECILEAFRVIVPQWDSDTTTTLDITPLTVPDLRLLSILFKDLEPYVSGAHRSIQPLMRRFLEDLSNILPGFTLNLQRPENWNLLNLPHHHSPYRATNLNGSSISITYVPPSQLSDSRHEAGDLDLPISPHIFSQPFTGELSPLTTPESRPLQLPGTPSLTTTSTSPDPSLQPPVAPSLVTTSGPQDPSRQLPPAISLKRCVHATRALIKAVRKSTAHPANPRPEYLRSLDLSGNDDASQFSPHSGWTPERVYPSIPLSRYPSSSEQSTGTSSEGAGGSHTRLRLRPRLRLAPPDLGSSGYSTDLDALRTPGFDTDSHSTSISTMDLPTDAEMGDENDTDYADEQSPLLSPLLDIPQISLDNVEDIGWTYSPDIPTPHDPNNPRISINTPSTCYSVVKTGH